MAAKGNIAKENVKNILMDAFGEKYIGEIDKKHYVWVDDGGEDVQIAISLVCPKTFVESINANGKKPDLDFDNMPSPAEPAVVSAQETENIQAMMKRLGLF